MNNNRGGNRPPQRSNERPTQRNTQNTSNPQRKRRKKQKNLLPILVLAIIVVVIFALIIMGIRAIFDNSTGSAEEESSSPSSLLDQLDENIVTPTPAPTATPEPTPATEIDVSNAEVQELDTMLIVDDRGYEFYKFNNTVADAFISAMNKASESASNTAKVHSLILPSAIDVMLPLSFLDNYAEETSDQDKAIQYIYSKLDTNINTISVYEALKAHCNEDIFFRTDNHISGLGGFYVYEALASSLKLNAKAFSSYEKKEYSDFLGNLFVKTENSAIGQAETLDVYIPTADLSLSYLDDSGSMTTGSLFPDVSEYGSMYKYSAYMGGSHGYSEISNGSITNDSACVVVIDSNGTPIVPYIAQHYQNTYVVDYRDYTDSVAELAQSKGASDIIYITSMVATSAQSLVYGLETVAK